MSIPISTIVVYEKNKQLFGSTLDWLSDVIKAVFIADGTTMDPAAHDFYDDIAAGAVSTPATLTTPTATADGTTGEGVLDGDEITSITTTGTWQYIVVMKWVTNSADSPLLFYGDAGSQQASGTFNIVWSADGIIRIA